jgi:uncharacterized membrane protein
MCKAGSLRREEVMSDAHEQIARVLREAFVTRSHANMIARAILPLLAAAEAKGAREMRERAIQNLKAAASIDASLADAIRLLMHSLPLPSIKEGE